MKSPEYKDYLATQGQALRGWTQKKVDTRESDRNPFPAGCASEVGWAINV